MTAAARVPAPIPITLPQWQRALFIRHNGKAKCLPPSIRLAHRPTVQIQELVALAYGLHPQIMTSPQRDAKSAWPRQVAMYLTRKFTGRSLTEIGRVFGGRDHSTVHHAIKVVEKAIEESESDREDIEAILKVLER